MWVKQVLAADISPTAKVIGVAISIHMNGDTRQAWPSHSTLARMCGVEKRTSERGVKELEKAGLLHISRVANRSNRYEMRRLKGADQDGTDEDVGRVPTAMVVPPDEDGTTPLTRMSPEPLNITSDLTAEYNLKGSSDIDGEVVVCLEGTPPSPTHLKEKESGERAPMGPSEADLSFEAYSLVAKHCSATQPEILDRQLRRKFPAAAERLAQLQSWIAAGKDIEGLAAEAA
jgi:hypothetical protein